MDDQHSSNHTKIELPKALKACIADARLIIGGTRQLQGWIAYHQHLNLVIDAEVLPQLHNLQIKMQGYSLRPSFYRGCIALTWGYKEDPNFQSEWAEVIGENLPRTADLLSIGLCEKASDTKVAITFQIKGGKRVKSEFMLSEEFVRKQRAQAEEIAPVNNLADAL